jgi:hypothetical protein
MCLYNDIIIVQQESSAPSAEQVQQLVDMGFDREIAMNALALCVSLISNS